MALATAATCRIAAVEAIEDVRQVVRRDRGARISHADAHRCRSRRCSDCENPTGQAVHEFTLGDAASAAWELVVEGESYRRRQKLTLSQSKTTKKEVRP